MADPTQPSAPAAPGPDPVVSAAAAIPTPAAEPAAAAVSPSPDAAAATLAPAPAPAADVKPADAKPAEPAPAPAQDFKPSLLDAAAKPEGKEGEAAKPAADVKPGDKPGGEKPADAAKPAEAGKDGAPSPEPPAPIEYAFTFPEGVKPDSVDKARMDAFTGTLNEAHVAPEIAQRFLDLHLKEVGEVATKLAQQQWDTFNAQQNRWREEVMADPILGGARHQTAVREIMTVVDNYSGNAEERQGLLDAFRITGIANNPHFLRFLHRASEDLTREAEPHPAPPPRAAAPTGRERGLNRYRNSTPANGAG